jgi:hypothetical protein
MRARPLLPVSAVLTALLALPGVTGLACVDGGGDGEGDGLNQPRGRTTFGWRAVNSAITPVWGGFVADVPGERTLLVGGVAGPSAPVLPGAEEVGVRGDGIVPASTIELDVARYCGCAFIDTARNELVVIGGRDGRFADIDSAAVIDLDDGTVTPLGAVLPSQHPVGCQAFYVPATDKGYVFSGLSSTQGNFGDTLARWDGETRTFTAVDVTLPPARYDASIHSLQDGRVLMLGGMGLSNLGALFHRDVWTFDGATETWTALALSTDASAQTPPGRRYAWSAVAPDDDTVLFGYGSDSPQGATMLGDLWRLSLSTGSWQPLDGELDGVAVPARGFASRLPGLPGTAGLLTGGMNADGDLVTDAFVLDVPADLDGEWR